MLAIMQRWTRIPQDCVWTLDSLWDARYDWLNAKTQTKTRKIDIYYWPVQGWPICIYKTYPLHKLYIPCCSTMKTKLISMTWLGSASVDPRFSASMLRWSVADIRNRDTAQKVTTIQSISLITMTNALHSQFLLAVRGHRIGRRPGGVWHRFRAAIPPPAQVHRRNVQVRG